ncbi:hypothetical protein GCM10009733_006220 [Nonomuraea maheshkhaliensis]|uniref:Uncharacterized protein n=1 Tax=Nonomuraea maheshkhaliensis TaxID=419590 RepID=A0ABN2ENM4_9ACTN
MPFATDLDQLARQRIRRARTAGALMTVLLGAALAILLSKSPQDPANADPTLAPTASVMPATPAPTFGYVTPARWVTLPEARGRLSRDYPVGWPRTPQGAAAAAAAMFSAVWDLDKGRALGAVDVYFSSRDRDESRREAAASVTWLRALLALPREGAPPAGATVAVQPVGVQWRIADAGNVYVSVAMRIDMIAGAHAPMRTVTVVGTGHLRWQTGLRGGDWAVLRTPAARMPRPVYADPGSAAFNSGHWRAIRPGE